MEDARFTSLLQPIRDLAKNWNVDIASELEDYLNEVEAITFSFDNGKTNLNFAEAALLIQGSACVYSKKVEYLYSLVYQTLDLLANRRNSQQNTAAAPTGNEDPDVREHVVPNFLELDDVTASTGAIDLDDRSAVVPGATVVQRTPISLLPIDDDGVMGQGQQAERGKFRINTSIISLDGALVLEEVVPATQYLNASSRPNSTLLDESMEGLGGNMDLPSGNFGPDDSFDVGGDDFSEGPDLPDALEAGVEERAVHHRAARDDVFEASAYQYRREPSIVPIDPYEPLDPHDPGTCASRPFKKGRTWRLPKKVDPDERSMFHISSTERSSNQPMAGLRGPVYVEFLELFVEEAKRRKSWWRNRREAEQYFPMEEVDDVVADGGAGLDALVDDDDDFDGGFGDTFGDDGMDMGGYASDDVDTTMPIPLGEEMDGADPQSYEELCRKHIELYLEDAKKYVKDTDLSRRVATWNDKIVPVLEEQDARAAFDIHRYSSGILSDLSGRIQEGDSMGFDDLVANRPSYEISRMFLATLQLANNGNLDITRTEGEVFSVELLTTQAAYDLENYRAPSKPTT